MKIIGFTYNKISVESKKQVSNGTNTNMNIEIKNIEKKDLINLSKEIKNQTSLSFSYEFKITYGQDIAEVFISGEIYALIDDEKLLKEILKDWKNKKVSNQVKLPLLNLILRKCNIKAIQLEDDLGLPPHIPFPRATLKTDDES